MQEGIYQQSWNSFVYVQICHLLKIYMYIIFLKNFPLSYACLERPPPAPDIFICLNHTVKDNGIHKRKKM